MNSSAVHQLVHTLSYGDAISGEVISLQHCLREMGLESEIYAINVHPTYKGKARKYTELAPDFSGRVILHYSIGSPLNAMYENMRSAHRTLVYHNLTPPEWFRGINPRIVREIEAGVAELPELCRISDSLLADSSFNLGELNKLGFEGQVLELPVDEKKWQGERNAGIYSLVKSEPGLHVLHVGRLAPNKCIEDIIKSFYFLHHHINKQSRLWLVGIDIDTELYAFSLKRLVQELRLEQAVNFVGCLADSEVRSLYEACSVYLCMSEHEGYCLPVIEAMHFGLPVISYGSSALPETMSDGGIVVQEKRHAEIAELISYIDSNAEFKEKLVQAGKRRVERVSFESFAANVKRIFSDFSSSGVTSTLVEHRTSSGPA